MSDGRAERGPLYELVRERLGERRDIELTAWLQSELNLETKPPGRALPLVHRPPNAAIRRRQKFSRARS